MGKGFKITIFILGGIFIAVLMALMFFAVSNGYSSRYMISKIFPGTVENIYKPYKIINESTSTVASVAGCDGFVYILDDKNLTIYDEKGNEKSSEILDFEDARISSGNKYLLVYDGPSGEYIIFKEAEKVYSDSIERTILGARMQDNGYTVFILKGRDGFLGSALVLNESNEIIAQYNYADRFPVSGCAIGSTGKFAISGIFKNNTDNTGIDIFEEYNNVPIAGLNREYLLPLIMPMGDDAIIAAGTEKVLIFNSIGSELASYNYNEIIRVDSSLEGCLIADRKTGSDKIIYLDKAGNEKWVYSTGLMTDGISFSERHVFYWSGINISCLDEKGNQIEIQGGVDLVIGIADIGNGKTVIVTAGNLIFNEYH
ncbi:MAG: hypothetical protein J7L77_07870 [Clostridiales bacterium]|nr:hypothetical protein [Clostridiales bacterium]